MRFEVLARLTGASPRVVDVWTATEIHHCGLALTDIRRLGVEYARAAAPAPPEDLLWWHRSLADLLSNRPDTGHSTLHAEFRVLARELAACLGSNPA
jgi:hypothetical protein